MAVADFREAQQRLIAHYSSDPLVCNRSRVLRLPGTLHLKDPANPQLVTFEDHTGGGDHWEYAEPVGGWLKGLAKLPPRKPISSSVGEPIAEKVLRTMLARLDPAMRYDEGWRNIIVGIGAANILGGDETGAIRQSLALEWSRGSLTGGVMPENYSEDAVLAVLRTMPPVEGGIGVGTVIAAARAKGWVGNPFSDGKPSETFEQFAKDAEAKRPTVPEPVKSRFTIWGTQDAATLPEPAWIVPELIGEGENCVFTASKGSFKSFLALDIGMSIATGLPSFARKPLLTGSVFYGAHEGALTLATVHVSAWMEENKLDPALDHGHYIMRGPKLGGTDHFEFMKAIQAKVAEGVRPPRLVILDTYSRCMGAPDENSPASANAFIDFCKEIQTTWPGCSVLVLAHTGKDANKGTRGSSAFEAGFEGVIDLERSRGTNNVAVRVRFQRSGKERDKPWYLKGEVVAGSLVFKPSANGGAEHSKKADANGSGLAAVIRAMLIATGRSSNIDYFDRQELAKHLAFKQFGRDPASREDLAELQRLEGIIETNIEAAMKRRDDPLQGLYQSFGRGKPARWFYKPDPEIETLAAEL
jgi:AAA domain